MQPPRHDHQVGKAHVIEKLFCADVAKRLALRAKPASATARRRFSGALAEHRPEGPLMRERWI